MGGRERGKDGMPHERENTRTGREKSFHSFISYRVGIVFLIWKPYIPVLASPPSPSLQAYSMSISSHLKTLSFVRCAEVSEQRSTSHNVSRAPSPTRAAPQPKEGGWNFIIIMCWSLFWLSHLWVANWPNIWLHNSKGAE